MDKSEKMIENYKVTTLIIERIIYISKNTLETDARGRVEELMYVHNMLLKDENVPSTEGK